MSGAAAESRRGPALLLVALVALVVTVAVLIFGRSAERGAFAENYSTFRATPEGAKALYRLFERLGAHVDRHTERLVDLENADILFVLEPASSLASPLGPDEAKYVKRWVEAGGTLVVAATNPTALHTAFDVRLEGIPSVTFTALPFAPPPAGAPPGPVPLVPAPADPPKLTPEEAKEPIVAAVPSAAARGVARLESDAEPTYLATERDDAVPIFRRGEKTFALAIRAGSGRAVFFAHPAIFANRRLAAADNAVLAANLIAGRPADGRVAFDEYHHGFTGDRGVAGYLGRRSLAPVLVQAGAAFLVLAAALGGRRGRPVLLEEELPPQSRESVRAMAEIYDKARLRAYCARELHASLVRRIQDALGLAGTEAQPPSDFLTGPIHEVLRRAGVRSFRALDGIARRRAHIEDRERRGAGATEHDLLLFAREIGRFEAELRQVFGKRFRAA